MTYPLGYTPSPWAEAPVDPRAAQGVYGSGYPGGYA